MICAECGARIYPEEWWDYDWDDQPCHDTCLDAAEDDYAGYDY
jgi:hypothetical protein